MQIINQCSGLPVDLDDLMCVWKWRPVGSRRDVAHADAGMCPTGEIQEKVPVVAESAERMLGRCIRSAQEPQPTRPNLIRRVCAIGGRRSYAREIR